MTDVDTQEKWAAYRGTVLELPGTPAGERALRVDLREPVAPALAERLAAHGIAPPVAIFTAENPHGENADDERNARAAARGDATNLARTVTLVEALRETGRPTVRIDGMAPDGSYRERCVAVPMSREDAAALARRLAQLAFFWFDGERVWLVPGLADQEAEPLPAAPGVKGPP